MNRYEFNKQINSGAFGNVFEALDKKSNTKVAIKKVHKKFYELNQRKKNREVKVLNTLSHPNIITLKDFIQKGSCLYFVFELMEYNLYEVIENRKGAPFPLPTVQNIIYQILDGLSYLHSQGYFHRDIKPENILVSNTQVKIADFGLVRELNTGSKRLSKCVSTSWYRAPEIFLGYPDYNSSIDIWGVGAIAAEIMTLRPLFPGKNDSDQIYWMCHVLGSPSEPFSLGGKWELGAQLAAVNDIRFPKVEEGALRSILKAYPYLDNTCFQFVVSLLQYDPNLRATASEALDHPFFDSMNKERVSSDLSISYPPFPKEVTNMDLKTKNIELPALDFSPTLSPFIDNIASSDEGIESITSSDQLSETHSILNLSGSNLDSRPSSFCSLNNLPQFKPDISASSGEHQAPVPFYVHKEEIQSFGPPSTKLRQKAKTAALKLEIETSDAPASFSSKLRRQSSAIFYYSGEEKKKAIENTNPRRHSLYEILDPVELETFPITQAENEPTLSTTNPTPINSPSQQVESIDLDSNLSTSTHSKLNTGLRRMSNILSKEFINLRRSSTINHLPIKTSPHLKREAAISHLRGVSLTQSISSKSYNPPIHIKERSYSISSPTSSFRPNQTKSELESELIKILNSSLDGIATEPSINRLSDSWRKMSHPEATTARVLLHTNDQRPFSVPNKEEIILEEEMNISDFRLSTATAMASIPSSSHVYQSKSHPEKNPNAIRKAYLKENRPNDLANHTLSSLKAREYKYDGVKSKGHSRRKSLGLFFDKVRHFFIPKTTSSRRAS